MSLTEKISRRRFIAEGACGTMGYGAMINTVAQLQMIQSAAADTADPTVPYRALVCLFLRGGCDMNNVLVPIGSNPQKATYLNDRGVVAVTEDSIATAGTEINYPSSSNKEFGIHPSMPNLARIFNEQDAAFVTNVGTLAYPTTPANYDTIGLPRQLFSHSDQVSEWMSSISDQPYSSGWGARVADLYHDTWNPDTQTSMLITAAGNSRFLNGGSETQYSVTTNGAISLSSFGTNYSSALNPDGSYRTNTTGQRLRALEMIMEASHVHLIQENYATVVRRARENEEVIAQAVQASSGFSLENGAPLDLEAIFTSFGATDGIGDEFLITARLIAGRSTLGNKRQIFFVDAGGYDNHADINNSLPENLESIDRALGAFNEAMQRLAEADPDFSYDQVTTFQASDFNRTWTPNSENPATAGTDHAWGSHSIIMGGGIQGGTFYGEFPELAVGGLNDTPRGSRGRWIPTTSVDQFSAVLANWMGVPPTSSQMETILPNLGRFENAFGDSANLKFFG